MQKKALAINENATIRIFFLFFYYLKQREELELCIGSDSGEARLVELAVDSRGQGELDLAILKEKRHKISK